MDCNILDFGMLDGWMDKRIMDGSKQGGTVTKYYLFSNDIFQSAIVPTFNKYLCKILAAIQKRV